MGPRAGLDRCGKSRPQRDSIPGSSSPQSVATTTEKPGPLRPVCIYGNLISIHVRELMTLFVIISRWILLSEECLRQKFFAKIKAYNLRSIPPPLQIVPFMK